ncbi:DUF1707 and DUF2154 domain-containing protein [Nakamurella antarctica]|uniref:DUF1707 and DUF2154 domain-containing protein n=1 Tax=Nakamurella antarctica TaxID=1902245 RepID=A0A3G8ZJ14_9ACTN|nr:DUF1707 domain-containing protein [Nakamurella antarctica]AZI57372.1 DUF1707 and DUF2154 domain-containing protein [Nakamurella antarctica]
MTDTPITPPGDLRASDADRERVAHALNTAMAEGRLSVDELSERLASVYAARTLSALVPLTTDLPEHGHLWPAVGAAVAQTPSPGLSRVGGNYPVLKTAIAVMGGRTIRGRWKMPARLTAVALMGGVEIDVTHAQFSSGEVTITAVALMGGVEITVPEDVRVICSGIGIMGAFDDKSHCDCGPNAPVLRVNGVAVMGGVEIKRAKPDPESVNHPDKQLR